MDAPRMETPAWQTSDTCQECNAPFFWNVSAMWQMKVCPFPPPSLILFSFQVVGLRQHHCRTCGHAVCNSCCSHRTTFPPMGFELPVRICKSCQAKMADDPSKFESVTISLYRWFMSIYQSSHCNRSLSVWPLSQSLTKFELASLHYIFSKCSEDWPLLVRTELYTFGILRISSNALSSLPSIHPSIDLPVW